MTLLGIGGAFDADRGVANTGALLTFEEGDAVLSRVLIDCGHTCGRQLHALGLTYDDIDTVLVTHAHGDHIDGLEVLGYKSLFLFNKLRTVIARGEVLDMTWRSLAPKMGRLQTAKGASGPADINVYFAPQPAGDAPVPLVGGRIEARFIPVVHVDQMPAYAIVLDLAPGTDNGPIIRWSGDCIFDETHAIFDDFNPNRGDVVFHDCLFYPYYDATVHTHFESLCTLPAPIREQLVLIHHGQVAQMGERRDEMLLGQALQVFEFSSNT